MLRANVYIDGFNFYYQCVKDTPYKWLNFRQMVELIYPTYEIARIRYFTAKVNPRPNDPQLLQRQETYLRALNTVTGMPIHLGQFRSHVVKMPLSNPSDGRSFAHVIKTEEKGSDVNLASYLLLDSFRHDHDVAIVVTNDSDLVTPVSMVKNELGLFVSVLNPQQSNKATSWGLAHAAGHSRKIREGNLRRSQFSLQLEDAQGIFHKPSSWE